MGIIPDNLDDEFEETEAGGGGGLLPAGEYEGVVTDLVIAPSKFRPWRTAELSGKLTVDDGDASGGVTFFDFEVAPLTDKEGNTSKGKLKFLKWQLTALGYDGKLSELEQRLHELNGARVSFEQKDEASPNINPKSGKPYRDREAILKDNLAPGYGSVASSAPTEEGAIAAPPVY